MGESRGRRATLETTLDRAVRGNRFTLAVTVPAVGAVLLVAGSRGVVPVAVVRHPVLMLAAVGAMRLPLAAALSPAIDRRAAAGVVLLSGFAYAVEFVGLTTGVPYGHFAYTADLGPTLGEVVPLALPLLYVPLVLDSYLLGLALLGRRSGCRAARVIAGLVTLLAVDLVLDPGAVAVGFWRYAATGAYYGVPVTNFAGWLLTGSVAVSIVDRTFDSAVLDERRGSTPYALDDLVSFLVLWGGVNLAVGNWGPVVIAAGLGAVVTAVDDRHDRRRRGAVERWPVR